MTYTKEEALFLRAKRQTIHHQLVELLCTPAESDHEYFLNLMIAQETLSHMLADFQSLAFLSWLEGEEQDD